MQKSSRRIAVSLQSEDVWVVKVKAPGSNRVGVGPFRKSQIGT